MNMPVFDENHDAMHAARMADMVAQAKRDQRIRNAQQLETFRLIVLIAAVAFAAGWVAGCITMLVAG